MVFEEPQPFRWPELPERREFAEAEDSDRIWPMLSEIYPDDFDPLADRSPYVPQLTNFADAFKIKVSGNDTTPRFLWDKLASDDGSIIVAQENDGYDEYVNLTVDETQLDGSQIDISDNSETYKVKVTSDDTTPNFLLSKLASSDGTIVIAEANAGADEDVDLTVDETKLHVKPVLIKAKEDMTADDTFYNCVYLDSDGTEGAGLTCKRPSAPVRNGDWGYLGKDSSGENMFIPAWVNRVRASLTDTEQGFLDAKVQKSITVNGTDHKLELDGDEASPGNSKYYGTDASGTKGFHAVSDLGHIEPETPSTYVVLGSNDEGSEAADSTNWLISTDRSKGLRAWWMWRVAYFDAGDQKLYGYLRRAEFDKYGHLTKVTAEARIEIDVPEAC